MDMHEEGVAVVLKRAEIDTRPPFRSVKEAVTLFGEKVLAGELYANNLDELNNGDGESKLGNVTAELEETKQSLKKAKEESMMMASCLSSLKEELERTKRELQQFKVHGDTNPLMESEILEDVKIVEDSTKLFAVKSQAKDEEEVEFQKKRYVTFANPPSLTQVVVPAGLEALERHPSLRKKKKKPLIPLIGGIFSKIKATSKFSTSA